ncbi:L,D-transpeptidase family protein [Pseudoflavitalea sp. X16]|uniref:L,D-transpeptidase family protein n=1 Tax=Paraflavitalea devenefica TaxID=2716334 RepID=UPI001422E5F6|nr:L,D-transpeptidase family protein [Paraflavitalea devenefica]NII29113.1 L,D-transpeptidase family protein [Paraflavitalea devenefica]
MKYVLIVAAFLLTGGSVWSQTTASSFNFVEYQKTFPRTSDAWKRKEDTLMKQFQEKGLAWPFRYMYVRSFKYDSQLEVWVKYEQNEPFKLFKTYKVCALAGTLGPKRMQGDYQVPEGFYYINEFNPKSQYHLSLGLNYPNASDRILSDSLQPGGDIYIHGSCVTTGCIPITDQQIEEIYILAAHARSQGQDFIPVHIFPIHFKNQRSSIYLDKYMKDFPEYAPMADELKHAYLYFEKTKKLPVIMVSKKGDYVVEGAIPVTPDKAKVVKKRDPRPAKEFTGEIAAVVNKLPVFPGGNTGFQAFIDKLSHEMAQYLEEDQKKAYVMVEFVIDKEGKPGYTKVIKGGNDELNDKLIDAFDKMPNWTPAVRLEQHVAVKLKQSLFIERLETSSTKTGGPTGGTAAN